MTDITEINTNYNLSSLITNIENLKYNPSGIISATLEYLSNVTDGKVNIVDPTNPFVMLLESSAVNTAAAITENTYLLRKQYPILAQTEDDLYRHMSDKDFLDRFSSPSRASFQLVIQYSSLFQNAVEKVNESCHMVTIPRNSMFYVEDIPFSIQYPINIKIYESGNIVVSYDTSIKSPLLSLTTNIIPCSVFKANDGTKCLAFSVDTEQFSIKSINSAIDKSTPYKNTIPFDDKYYFCRVFYRSAKNNTWTEMKTTHTDQVYDIDTPTAILQVKDKFLTVSIPLIYTNSDMVSGELRIDIYTTKGELTLNLADYNVNTSFSTKLYAVDESRDMNAYTLAMTKVDYYSYCSDTVMGGYNGLSFDQLKSRVINNSLGDPDIPITSVQLEDSKVVEGFEIAKNIDSLTNRIFVASKGLPTPQDSKLITPANITIMSLLTDMSSLKMIEGCYDNGDRVTISTDVIFKDNNGALSIIDKTQVNKLRSMKNSSELVDEINNNSYFYSPFHYVVNNSNGLFSMTPYYLDNPLMSKLSFIEQNTTMNAVVNTSSYYIAKVDDGYNIVLVTASDQAYKSIKTEALGVVLSFIPHGEKTPVYIKGRFSKVSTGTTTKGELVFLFELKSNFDIDEDDCLYINNCQLTADSTFTAKLDLNTTFNFFYCTKAIPLSYTSSIMDKEFPYQLYEDGEWLPITQENINVDFGVRLDKLWSQTKSVYTEGKYDTYKENVPMTYEEDIFKVNEDGTIVSVDENGVYNYTLLHAKGDIVYNDNEEIIYLHKKGDIKYDENNKPISISEEYISRILDILLIDGCYLFTTDPAYVLYRRELTETIVSWIDDDLDDINDNLLEQTRIFYRPKKALGDVKVAIGDNKEVYIESAQSFEVTLYVNNILYDNTELKTNIEDKIISLINTILSNKRICNSELVESIKSVSGSSLITATIKGLGGLDKNYETISMVEDTERLCLRKKLELQNDGNYIVKEDVKFIYIKV